MNAINESKKCIICGSSNPIEAKFCRKCGRNFDDGSLEKKMINPADDSSDVRPYHIRHPELNLLPASDSKFEDLLFWFNRPEYIEDPCQADDSDYLYIVRKGKIGILHWTIEKHWYGNEDIYSRIIPCIYDHIEKADGYFICHKESKIEYRDMKGNILR